MFSLENRVALVTGGEHGIGKGIASVLHKAGARIVIGGIDEKAGKQVAQDLNGAFIKLDVTRQGDCQAAIAWIEAEFGQLDILCSNAGIFPQANLHEMTEAQWDEVHNVNLKGTFFIVQAAMAPMKKRGYGRIVMTSSITGPITGFPGWSHYGASKAGQLGFMRSAALEMANSGITINAVMPGNVLTEGLQAQGEAYLDQMRAAIPTHTLGTPDDIGHAACFLASEEARYITGQQIVVDGGQVLPESPDAIPGQG